MTETNEDARPEPTAGERAHPDWAYRLPYGGHLLMGPCDTPGCPYASKPGGDRHDGACDPRKTQAS